jgi:type I restriction enzyme S subunit
MRSTLPESPSAWRRTTLGDLVRGERGFLNGPFGSELRASEYVEAADGVPAAGVPVVMPKDLVDGAASGATAARISPKKAARLEPYRVRPGDLLFARRGEVGRCALVTADEAGWVCGTGCVRARLEDSVDPRFLLQYLQWRPTKAWIRDHAVGQTMPSINLKILERVPVRLPPPREQRRIAAALQTAADAVRSSRAVVEQTRKVHEALMRLLFIPEPGRRRPLGSITALPTDWALRTLGELATFTNGHRFKAEEWSDAGLPIVRIQNLNGSRDFNYFAGLPKPGWKVEPGELLFAWAGQKRVSFGPRRWDGPHGVLNQHIFRVRPRQDVSKTWLYGMLRLVTRQIEEKAHGFKASLVHVRKGDVTGQAVPVPPLAEQLRIAARFEELEVREELEVKALEHAVALERGLQDDLLSGRVRCRPASIRLRKTNAAIDPPPDS